MGGLKGVQIPHPCGGKFRQMMIYVDPDKLRAHHLSPADVVKAVNEANLVLASATEDGPTTIPLSEVADIKRVNIPGEVAHCNISRVSDVYVNVAGRDLGSVARGVEKIVSEMEFDLGVGVTLRGPVTKMKEGCATLGWGLPTAAVLVYLVMMAQFRSMIDPLIIMLAVLLGLTGVLGILWLTDTNLNIQSLMGTSMMIGVVVNNSFLLVEFANHLHEKGLDSFKAAWTAACIRLRPIMMTALVLVASMLPLLTTMRVSMGFTQPSDSLPNRLSRSPHGNRQERRCHREINFLVLKDLHKHKQRLESLPDSSK